MDGACTMSLGNLFPCLRNSQSEKFSLLSRLNLSLHLLAPPTMYHYEEPDYLLLVGTGWQLLNPL